uniref:Uncharacterized protein n=1 Tax=Panagrolaimus davidi TaxID=227884 RepID=A0A914QNG2_9BILA
MADDDDKPLSSKSRRKAHITSFADLQTEILYRSRVSAETKFDDKHINRSKNNILAMTKAEKQAKEKNSMARKERIQKAADAIRKEDEDYERRKRTMEEKAKLYERLKSGERLVYEDGTKPDYLVDFDRQERSPSPPQRSRSRSPRERSRSRSPRERSPQPPPRPLIVHYDPSEDKGRIFGAAHVPLPQDEDERQKKIGELEALTRQTFETRKRRKKERSEEERAKRDRLNFTRSMKGLPPLESSDEEEEQHPGANIDLSSIPMPADPDAERRAEEERKKKYEREWDRGKMRDMQWVKEKRNEREDEFKPPDSYYR